jgi:hypothetical protein
MISETERQIAQNGLEAMNEEDQEDEPIAGLFHKYKAAKSN